MNQAFAETYRNSPSGRLEHVPKGNASYWAFVPNPLPPDLALSNKVILLLSDANRALGELSGVARLVPNPNLLIRPYSRREAVSSSRIEGTQASFSDLLFFEAADRPEVQATSLQSQQRQRADIQEVLNYVRAMEYGLERLKTLPLSLRLIREMHEILMQGVRGQEKSPGEFRTSQNWIGRPGCSLDDAMFVPPTIDAMNQCLSAWERFLHAESELPILIQCALMHCQFEAIHPFLDGNGRIGRLLIILFLRDKGVLSQPILYLSPFFDRYRDWYYHSLTEVSHLGNWNNWFEMFLRGIQTQALDAVIRSTRILFHRERYQDMAQKSSRTANLLSLVDVLFETPFITAPMVARRLSVTFLTAQSLCQRLVDLNILRELTETHHPKVYFAWEILNVLEEEQNKTA